MSGFTMQARFEEQRRREWKQAGISDRDIAFAFETGISAPDVAVFRKFSRGCLIITRCPKRTSLPWHGMLTPKIASCNVPSNDSGLTGKAGVVMVSDYDLMCVFRERPSGLERVVIAADNGKKQGRWSMDGTLFVRALNAELQSRIQHGCNDDWDSPDNRGVKPTDTFAAFRNGLTTHLNSPAACEEYYVRAGIFWPYDGNGRLRRRPVEAPPGALRFYPG